MDSARFNGCCSIMGCLTIIAIVWAIIFYFIFKVIPLLMSNLENI